MLSLNLTDIKDFTSHLFLKDTFDEFCFIEGEIVTFNTFRINGAIQKEFFDSDAVLPEYSCWKNIREYCRSLIKGKRTPLDFRFILSLPPESIGHLVAENLPSLDASNIQGLYLNLHFNKDGLSCVTGTSFKTFTPDKSLEHMWDETVQKFFRHHGIIFELS